MNRCVGSRLRLTTNAVQEEVNIFDFCFLTAVLIRFGGITQEWMISNQLVQVISDILYIIACPVKSHFMKL